MSKLNRILWAGLVLGVAACGDDVTVTQPPEPTPGIRSVTVAPNGVTIQVGGTVTMTAAVVTDPGAATPTIAWSSSAPAVATVGNTSGVVTGVAAGSAGITATATSGTSVASGNATVTVVAAPACVINSVTVSPSAAALVVGQTLPLAATVQGTNCAAGDLGVTYSGGTAGVATINATSGVITAVGAGNTTFTATSTKDATKKAVMSVSVSVPAPATVTIESITQGNLGTPVALNNVGGQVEVTLNIDPGAAPSVSKAQVLIGGTVVAEQTYGSASAGAEGSPALAVSTVVLSTNTRQVQKVNGLYVPVVFNGPSAFTARIYVAGSTTPAVSNAIPVVMQNADAMIGGTWTLAPASASPSYTTGGNTWYKGNVTFAGGNYVSFFPVTPAITMSSTCGASNNATAGTPTTGISLSGTLTCGNTIEGTVAPTGTVTVTPGTAPAADVIYIAATGYQQVGTAYTVDGSQRWNLLTGGAYGTNAPTSVRIDNKAPVLTPNPIGFLSGGAVPFNCETTGNTPGCWVGTAYNLVADFPSADGGTGVASTGIFEWIQNVTVPYCSTTPFSIASAAEVTTANAYDVCAVATDNLGNASNARGFNLFSVDKTNPTLTYNGTYDVAGTVNPDVVNTLPITVLDYKISDNNSGLAGTNNVSIKLTFTRVLNSGGAASITACPTLPNTALGAKQPDNSHFLATTFVPDNGCTLPGEYTWSAMGYDRAGNAAGPIVRQMEYNPSGNTAVSAINVLPLYAANADISWDMFASDDEDLADAQIGLNYVTSSGAAIQVLFGPSADFFTGIFGSSWNGLLYLATPTTGYRLTLPAAYNIIGYADDNTALAGTPPWGTAGIDFWAGDTYGDVSPVFNQTIAAPFMTASSWTTTNPWASGTGTANETFTTIPGDATSCAWTYETPTNNPTIITRVWAADDDGAGTYTVIGDVNSSPILVSDGVTTRVYRHNISSANTCAALGIDQIMAIKSNVAWIY